MSGIGAFRYDGKRVVVVGGATGMGAAAARTCAELGGEVVVFDHAAVDFDVAQLVNVDLRDREAIDAALAELSGPVDALVSAAGVADGTDGVMKINFIGHRHLIDCLVADGRLGRGSAICFISSVAGIGWESQLDTLLDFLATTSYDEAVAWVEAHDGTDSYGFSKMVINAYIARQAFPMLTNGIRINAILPGPTDTPLARANADLWLTFAQGYRDATGTEHLTPAQMGDVIAFLCSDAASGINGVTLLVDGGHTMASLSGSYEPDQALMRMLAGRVPQPGASSDR